MAKEDWRDIEGFEGLYQISNLGRVKSLDRLIPHSTHGMWHLKERILKPSKNGAGYLYVILFDKEKKAKNNRIHRLVAEHFVPNLLSYPQVNHIDGDKANNSAINLEWVTALGNSQHAWENGLCENARVNDHTKRKCICVETKITYNSIEEAGRAINRAASNISRACRHNTMANGYHFRYI